MQSYYTTTFQKKQESFHYFINSPIHHPLFLFILTKNPLRPQTEGIGFELKRGSSDELDGRDSDLGTCRIVNSNPNVAVVIHVGQINDRLTRTACPTVGGEDHIGVSDVTIEVIGGLLTVACVGALQADSQRGS